MAIERWVLFASLALVAYTWVGYPLLLWLLHAVFRVPIERRPLDPWPLVSVVIAARNEEDTIAAKLMDCARFQYPPQRLEFIVISDNSSDRTEAIVAEVAAADTRVKLVASRKSLGKSSAQNLGVEHARGDVLLFTDANTNVPPEGLMLALENLADGKVGLVTADVHFGSASNAVAAGQSAYWRFELFLRKLESETGILATASGQFLLVRRSLYRDLPTTYGDDCILPMDVRLQRHRVVQDGRVCVHDSMPSGISSELRARIRMTARNWSGTWSRGALLNPFRFPLTSWSLASHKLLRWLTPFLLELTLLVNLIMAIRGQFALLLVAQAAFYIAALVGWLRTRQGEAAWMFGYPFAFCLANYGFLMGMVQVMRRRKIVSY